MSKKKKPNRQPFYAQLLTERVRSQDERRKALNQAAERVLKPIKDSPPK
jgi:hypothetical protein